MLRCGRGPLELGNRGRKALGPFRRACMKCPEASVTCPPEAASAGSPRTMAGPWGNPRKGSPRTCSGSDDATHPVHDDEHPGCHVERVAQEAFDRRGEDVDSGDLEEGPVDQDRGR